MRKYVVFGVSKGEPYAPRLVEAMDDEEAARIWVSDYGSSPAWLRVVDGYAGTLFEVDGEGSVVRNTESRMMHDG